MPVNLTGFTKIGLKYINQSIELYLYCILGLQAKTRQSFLIEQVHLTQQFRKLVEDTVLNYNISNSVMNMNRAITDCNLIYVYLCFHSRWVIILLF